MTEWIGVGPSAQPGDRLTELSCTGAAAIKGDPAYREGDKVIVLMLNHDEGTRGAALGGYDPEQAHVLLKDLMIHVQTMMHSAGHPVRLVPVAFADPN